MFRSRSWFSVPWNKPKNKLSLEHLKYLYSILEKNTTVSENNRGLLVESLRCIAEILIWGDQHDSSVFDFFLEKNMLSYFLNIMRQKSGGSSFVCVQLLQTLNILFENIRNETSLYYLLSNNHVNSIIVHKFDFSDEDVMGYYILFLKTLSLKLNTHTIHFFYNEHTNDFPLYTEAIKFFNHPESMVRIAVRTISLNVYGVRNTSMLQFITDKTAAPYFSNLVWFIGKHILELNACVLNDIDHQSNQRLSNLVAEHLDHLHYLNDILMLGIADLNAVLTEHLLHKLFVPLYVFSLTPIVLDRESTPLNASLRELQNPRISSIVALFLLALVFLVVNESPLVHALAWVILNGDNGVFEKGAAEVLNAYVERREPVVLRFGEPQVTLQQALDIVIGSPAATTSAAAARTAVTTHEVAEHAIEVVADVRDMANVTDEEKEILRHATTVTTTTMCTSAGQGREREQQHPFIDTIITLLDCTENDYFALLSLCVIYAMAFNRGIKNDWFEQTLSKSKYGSTNYKTAIIERLLAIVTFANQQSCRIRLITIEIALQLLDTMTKAESGGNTRCITTMQQESLFAERRSAMAALHSFYKSEDIFLDLFEDEFNEMKKSKLDVEVLCMDASILLPPTGTPLTGISFTRRLPCGEVEKARRAIRLFLLLRRACQRFLAEEETILPLTNALSLVKENSVLDLNNSDLLACTVLTKGNARQHRFLVIDSLQLILVEPDSKRLGWGVTRFVGFLQDIEVQGDKDDSRCLYITVHRGGATHNRTPLLAGKFVFDDHIRCMAAKQRLTKGRSKARQKKMCQIAHLLELHTPGVEAPVYAVGGICMNNAAHGPTREHRPILCANICKPGFAAALNTDSGVHGLTRVQMAPNRSVEGLRGVSASSSRSRRSSANSSSSSNSPAKLKPRSDTGTSSSAASGNRKTTSRESTSYSRGSSPASLVRPRSEEIPLEHIQHSRNNSPNTRNAHAVFSSGASSRSNTPSRTILIHDQLTVAPVEQSMVAASQFDAEEVSAPSLEETSFIRQDTERAATCDSRRKGMIETV